MSALWTDTITRLNPYVPGEQRHGTDIVKLNTNENPYPPSPEVLQAIAGVSGDQLRRYPDPESVELRQALANYHCLDIDEVFVGNGSDEILGLAFLAYFTNDKVLQFPQITYSFYPVYCALYRICAKTIDLETDYSINLDRFEPNAGGIVFPNPNAPTGMDLPLGEIEKLLAKHTEHVLLVDEAYTGFGAQSAIPLVKHHPNLLISQTFSKGRSLAGLRLGVAFGHRDLIAGLQRVKNSFNSFPVDALAQTAGIASLKGERYYQSTTHKIVQTRQDTVVALRKRGFEVLPSSANFVFARPPEGTSAHYLYRKLNDAGVLVRYWSKPKIDEWLRITIGTPQEMQMLMRCLDA